LSNIEVAHTFDAAVVAELGLTAPAIILFKTVGWFPFFRKNCLITIKLRFQFDQGKATYSGPYESSSILKFFSSESVPLVRPLFLALFFLFLLHVDYF
jgi:hypothetical protein